LEKVHKSVASAMSEFGSAHDDAMAALGQVKDYVQSVLTPNAESNEQSNLESQSVASRLDEAHKSAKETHRETMRSMQRFKTHMQRAIDNLAMLCDYVSPDDSDDNSGDGDADSSDGDSEMSDSVDPSGEEAADANASEETNPSADKIFDAMNQELAASKSQATNGDNAASNDLKQQNPGAPPASQASKAATSDAETVE